jgi:hypothetical protein
MYLLKMKALVDVEIKVFEEIAKCSDSISIKG